MSTGPKRVVLDTSVWVSALLFRGPPRTLIELAVEGRIQILISPSIRAEIIDVLARPKFGLAPEQLDAISESLEIADEVMPSRRFPGCCDDPDDEHVLEAAVAARADALVTGDQQHLIPLGTFEGIPIRTVRQFLDELAREE